MTIERRTTLRLAKLRDLIDRDAYEINLDRLAKRIVDEEIKLVVEARPARD